MWPRSLGTRCQLGHEMNIVKPGSTFRPVSSRTFYESDYVASILLVADQIFPGFHCGAFSPLVASEHGTARPDLVLIDHLYRNWFVVEVELEHHSLSGHVEPQIRRLSNGLYTAAHSLQLHDMFPDTSQTNLSRMVRSSQPEVVVIAPEIRPRWVPALKSLGAILMILQVFEDDHGTRLFGIDGETIRSYESHVIGIAQRTPAIRIALKISGVANETLGPEVDLLFEGEVTRWKVVRTGTELLFLPRERCPLPEQLGESYIITETDKGMWRLESRGN